MRLCLYYHKKPTEPINHNSLDLGAVWALTNSFVYTPSFPYLHSVLSAFSLLLSAPAGEGTKRLSALSALLSENYSWGVSGACLPPWSTCIIIIIIFFISSAPPGLQRACVLQGIPARVSPGALGESPQHFTFCAVRRRLPLPLPVFL